MQDATHLIIPYVPPALMVHTLAMEVVCLVQLAAAYVQIKMSASAAQRDISQGVLLFSHLHQDHPSVLNVNHLATLALIQKLHVFPV